MLFSFANPQAQPTKTWDAELAQSMARIEYFYFNAHDLSVKVRQHVAHQKLFALGKLTPHQIKVVLAQWEQIEQNQYNPPPPAQSLQKSQIQSNARHLQPSLAATTKILVDLQSLQLGQLLQKAGLISVEQLEAALHEQSCDRALPLGQILSSRGWIQQETVDYFAEKLPKLSNSKWQHPLGHHLKSAALLNYMQISSLLQEQQLKGGRFGEIAVGKGWVKQATIDVFLTQLNP